MAFGINREELERWKADVSRGNIAFLTHFWYDPGMPDVTSITKVGCADYRLLSEWCRKHGLNPAYIHMRDQYPHFDLIGKAQKQVLKAEGQWEHIWRFGIT